MTEFTITYHWSKRSEPYEVAEERLEGSPLLWAALQRFMAEYCGTFTISFPGTELELWFDDDLSQTFDPLPDWLRKLANKPGESTELLFASQGTELKLLAVRAADEIALRFLSIAPDRPWNNDELPTVVPARRFFDQWKEFLNAVLDKLETFEPKLGEDAEFREYRGKLAAIA